MVRRAKQFSDLNIKWKPIPFSDLTAVLHTDASWGNAQRHGTQAGYIIGFTTKNLNTGLLGSGDLTGYNVWFLQRFLERLSPWPVA